MTRSAKEIVHDLANVLTVIRGTAEVIQHKVGRGDAAFPDLVRILHAAEETTALIRELRSTLDEDFADRSL